MTTIARAKIIGVDLKSGLSALRSVSKVLDLFESYYILRQKSFHLTVLNAI